ncbi:MAG: lysylphosphatidylglycerol synthase transmembrane domain-containing protein [Nanoarchaeota archaeon]
MARLQLRKYVFIGILCVIVLIIVLNLSRAADLFSVAIRIAPGWLLIAIGLQAMTYLFAANIYRAIIRLLGYTAKLSRLYLACITVFFLNQTVPSGGVSGNAFLFKLLERMKMPQGKKVLVVVLDLMIYYTAFVVLVLFGLFYLIIHKELDKAYLAPLFLAFGLLLGVSYLFLHLAHKKSRLQKFIVFLASHLSRIRKKRLKLARLLFFVDDLFEGKQIVKQHIRRFIMPLFFQFCIFFLSALTIAALFRGFGYKAHLTIVIAGLAISLLLSMVSFIPGGLGVFEASMAFVYANLGVPTIYALIVTLLYRVISFWLPLPFGLLIYRKYEEELKPNTNK